MAQDTCVGGMFSKFWCRKWRVPLLLFLNAPGGTLGAAEFGAHTGLVHYFIEL